MAYAREAKESLRFPSPPRRPVIRADEHFKQIFNDVSDLVYKNEKKVEHVKIQVIQRDTLECIHIYLSLFLISPLKRIRFSRRPSDTMSFGERLVPSNLRAYDVISKGYPRSRDLPSSARTGERLRFLFLVSISAYYRLLFF